MAENPAARGNGGGEGRRGTGTEALSEGDLEGERGAGQGAQRAGIREGSQHQGLVVEGRGQRGRQGGFTPFLPFPCFLSAGLEFVTV